VRNHGKRETDLGEHLVDLTTALDEKKERVGPRGASSVQRLVGARWPFKRGITLERGGETDVFG